jgi:hypothetical protein
MSGSTSTIGRSTTTTRSSGSNANLPVAHLSICLCAPPLPSPPAERKLSPADAAGFRTVGQLPASQPLPGGASVGAAGASSAAQQRPRTSCGSFRALLVHGDHRPGGPEPHAQHRPPKRPVSPGEQHHGGGQGTCVAAAAAVIRCSSFALLTSSPCSLLRLSPVFSAPSQRPTHRQPRQARQP